jgi:AraC family transcriptional regulator
MHDWETLTPLLVHIQANLDHDLSLAALGARIDLSPQHLQRVFKAAIGETPKAYVTRLRVERAAFCLLAHESQVAAVARECGFQGPETFIRAFRRRFGVSPRAYRSKQRAASARWSRERSALPGAHYELSKTRIIDIRPAHVAFRRHVGPYENVPESLFDELERWAVKRRLQPPRIWAGIGHDAPGVTPPSQLRFDAALVVPEPFEAQGLVGCQQLAGGPHAVTTHVGPYETLGAAYAQIFPRLATFREYDLVALPVLEIYHTARVSVRFALNHTDICLPMRRRTAS